MRRILAQIPDIIKNVSIKDIMSSPVSVLEENESAEKAAIVISKNNFSTIVVTKENKPIGMLSERDIITKILLNKKNPKKVKISRVMDRRIKSIGPETSLLKASSIMEREKLKKLVVVDGGGNLKGIVTQTDIIRAFNSIYKSYRHMLWSPYFFIAMLIIVVLLFLLNILLFEK